MSAQPLNFTVEVSNPVSMWRASLQVNGVTVFSEPLSARSEKAARESAVEVIVGRLSRALEIEEYDD